MTVREDMQAGDSGLAAWARAISAEHNDDHDTIASGRLSTAQLSATTGALVAAGVEDAQTFTATSWQPGAKRPVFTDMTTWVTKGSSSMGQMSNALAGLAAEAGVTVVNRAKAGERWEHMLARDGVAPAVLTFPSNTIPASGNATVTASIPASAALQSYRGTVGGVLGTLSSNGTTFTFARVAPGDAVTLAGPAQFIPAATASGGTPVNPSYRHTVMFLDAGKNNADDLAAADGMIAALDAEVDWLVPMVKRFLVLGLFPNTGATAAHKANITAVNEARAAKYGDRFLDIWAYIESGAAFTDTGLTETAGDTAQIAAFEKPNTLSDDNQHLLDVVWDAFVETVVRQRLIELGWYPQLAPWTPMSLPGLVAFVDPAEMSEGPVTSYTEPATGRVFAGTATVDADGISGTPALIFNGTTDKLVADLASAYTGDVTVLAYMQSITLTTHVYFYDAYNTGTSNALRLFGRRNSTNFAVGRGPAVTGPAGDGNAHRWVASYVGTTGTITIDSGSPVTGTINTGVTSPHDRLVIGARGDGADAHNCAIGVFAVVQGTVSAGDLAKWNEWLDARLP